MTNEVYDIDAMKALASATGARIEYDMSTPVVTLDGRRQVIKAACCDGFDCWTPRRKPQPGNDVTMWAANVTADQAVLFLNGASKQEAGV